jgi:hypothetical protein
MGVLVFLYMICALRTNVVFFLIFAFLVPSFGCLAGAYWHLAEGNVDTAGTLIVAAGALTFIVDLLGWWIFFAIMLASLDFPFQLPGEIDILYAILCTNLADPAFRSWRSLWRSQGHEREEEGEGGPRVWRLGLNNSKHHKQLDIACSYAMSIMNWRCVSRRLVDWLYQTALLCIAYG